MKKIVKSLILIAAAAMGFTACQKEIQEEVPVMKAQFRSLSYPALLRQRHQ